MTSSALMFPPHLNENPPQKRGVTGAPYTTMLKTNPFVVSNPMVCVVTDRYFRSPCFQ